MEDTKLLQHIKKTLAHTLFEHQYGIVDDEKNTSIVTTMVKYLQGLHDAHYIHDFALSVVNISDERISASVAVKHLEDDEFILIPLELWTRFEKPEETNFDRAMKGV